jgi:hypothetical protein
VVKVAGRSMLNQALFLGKKLGYEIVNVSEAQSMWSTDYAVIFRKGSV